MKHRVALMCVVVLASSAAAWSQETQPQQQQPQQAQSLTLVAAQPASVGTVTATGRVQSLVAAKIGPRVSGRIAEFATDENGAMLDAGMSVKAGQALFSLDETTFRNALAMAEAQLNSAQAVLANLTAPTREERLEQFRQAVAELDTRLADREREEQRYKRLVEVEKTLPGRRLEEAQVELRAMRALRAVAAARLKEAEAGPTPTEIAVAQARVREAEAAVKMAQDDLRDSTVRAPFDGLITRRNKSVGDYVTNAPPAEVIELVAVDKLEAELHLPEAYLAGVQAGKTPVVLRSPLLQRDLAVPVTRVVSDVDMVKGTFAVRVAVPADQRDRLAPGAFVTGEVSLEDSGQQVIVPQRAVIESEGKPAVFVAEDGRMVRRPVEVSDRLTESVVIRAGLSSGQQVLVGPAEAMQDGAALPGYLVGK